MGFTSDDFEKFLQSDDDGEPLGDALAALALDVDSDTVTDVRDVRERI